MKQSFTSSITLCSLGRLITEIVRVKEHARVNMTLRLIWRGGPIRAVVSVRDIVSIN